MYQAYEKSEPFTGNSRKALEFAATTLTSAGYRIEDRRDTSLTAQASRTDDWDRCQALLRNIVSIEIRASGNLLTARAELADYPVLQKFGGMVFGVLIAAGVYYYMSRGPRSIPADMKIMFSIFFAVYFLFTIVSAFTAVRWFRKGAWQSVDAFLHDLVIASGGSGAS